MADNMYAPQALYIYENIPENTIHPSMQPEGWTIFDMTVTNVDDGDTIMVTKAGTAFENSTVRFIGVNCPETEPTYGGGDATYKEQHAVSYAMKHGITKEQAYARGEESKAFTKSLIDKGSKVSINFYVNSWNGETPVYGKDEYGRYLGVIYRSGRNPININKSLLASGYGDLMLMNSSHVSVASWKYLEQQGQDSSQASFRQAEEAASKEGQVISIPPRVGYRDNSIQCEPMENVRISSGNRPPGWIQLGDVEFVVPPQSISVSKVMKNNRTPVLRGKGSIQTKSGYSDTIIQLELFFHNQNTINGYPITGPDGSTYYVNGLRPLIAQFKKTPFVPVLNEHLNGVHGVFSVTLSNMTAQTVPGFPDCLQVNLTLLKFEHQAFMPYTEDFYGAINWPIFRWFYQGPMNYKSNDRTYLQPIGEQFSSDLTFEIVDENQLNQLKQAVHELDITESPIQKRTTSESTLYGKVRHDGKVIEEGRAQKVRHDTYLNHTEYDNARRRVVQHKTVPLTTVLDGGSDTDDLVYCTPYIGVGSAGALDYHPAGETGNWYRLKALHYENIAMLEEAIENNIGVKKSSGYYYIPEGCTDILNKIYDRMAALEKAIDVSIEEYEAEKARIEQAEENLTLNPCQIDGLITQSITVGLENIISSAQPQEAEGPAHQYLGSQDTFIQIKMESTSKEAVTELVDIVKRAERFSREYKLGIVSGFLGVQNDIIQLFGIRHVLVENININTVRNYPGRYEITLTLVGFNKTQRRIESPKMIDLDTTWLKSADQVRAMYGQQDGIFELKLLELEVYPDLELPTWGELKEFLTKAKARGNDIVYLIPNEVAHYDGPPLGKFVDPDFYVSTPDTLRKDLHTMIGAEHKIGELISEGNDTASKIAWTLKDFNECSAVIKPPGANDKTIDAIKPLYNMSDSLYKYAETKQKEDAQLMQKYTTTEIAAAGTLPAGPVKSKKTTDISAITPTSSTENKVPGGDDTITRSNLKATPTITEWARWQQMDESDARMDMKNKIGINPTHKEVSDALMAEVNNLFKDTGLDINDAIYWTKALISQETGGKWHQFTSDGMPNIGADLDVGIGQFRPYTHGMDLDSARRVAWDWRFCLYVSIRFWRDKCTGVLKIDDKNKYSPDQNTVFRWALVAYNAGHVNGSTPETSISANYVRSATDWYNKLASVGKVDVVPEEVGSSYRQVTSSTIAKADALIAAGYDSTNTSVTAGSASSVDAEINAQQNPRTVMDSAPTLEPRIDPAALFADSFLDTLETDHRGRLLRAFPSFQMFLVDEGRWVCWLKMWDNFYGFNAIQSIDIVRSRKIAADTCVIKMTNIYDNLTRYELDLDHGHYDDKYEWHELLFSEFDNTSLIEARKERQTALFLRTGARIHLRMGYGACAADLPIVFNGTITELDSGGEILQIVAQGDGMELANDIGGDPERTNSGILMWKEARSTLCYLMARHNNLIYDWIESKMNKADPSIWTTIFARKENPLGIAHFGNPYEFPLDDKYFPWPWKREEKLGEIAANIYASNGLGTHSQWIHDPNSLGVKYGQKIEGSETGWHLAWGFVPWPDGDEPDVCVPLYGKSVWDVAQTLASCFPDYIATVMPMELRSTLFFGRPYWPIYYKYAWQYQWQDGHLKRTATSMIGKPLSQTHVYFGLSDILANNIRASSEGVFTNVIAAYKTSSGAAVNTMVVHADTDIYPEQQKTAIVDIDIIDEAWLQQWRSTSTKRLAFTAAAQTLRDLLKDMYKGDLYVLGDPSVKPHDTFFVVDEINSMNGMCGVKQVVHHMSHETGFVTNVSPDAIVVVDDKFYINYMNWQASVMTSVGAYTIGKWTAVSAWKKLTGSPLGYAAREGADFIGKMALKGVGKFVGDNVFQKAALDRFEHIIETQGWEAGLKYLKAPDFNYSSTDEAFDVMRQIYRYEGRAGSIIRVYDKLGDLYKAKNLVGATARGVAGVAKIMTSATGIGLAMNIASFMLVDSIYETYSRQKRAMQAVVVIPVKSHGRPLTAGLNGHQGVVVGDKPSKIDLFWEGKMDGAIGAIPKVLNFLSGDQTTFTNEETDYR